MIIKNLGSRGHTRFPPGSVRMLTNNKNAKRLAHQKRLGKNGTESALPLLPSHEVVPSIKKVSQHAEKHPGTKLSVSKSHAYIHPPTRKQGISYPRNSRGSAAADRTARWPGAIRNWFSAFKIPQAPMLNPPSKMTHP